MRTPLSTAATGCARLQGLSCVRAGILARCHRFLCPLWSILCHFLLEWLHCGAGGQPGEQVQGAAGDDGALVGEEAQEHRQQLQVQADLVRLQRVPPARLLRLARRIQWRNCKMRWAPAAAFECRAPSSGITICSVAECRRCRTSCCCYVSCRERA